MFGIPHSHSFVYHLIDIVNCKMKIINLCKLIALSCISLRKGERALMARSMRRIRGRQ